MSALASPTCSAPTPLALAHSLTASSDESGLFCGYSGRKCPNLRTDKKGGGLHRFCEFHRQRANKNQRRVDLKRREQRAKRRQLLRQLSSRTTTTKADTDASHDAPLLTDEDIFVLHLLLFDDEKRHLDDAANEPVLVAIESDLGSE